MEFNSLPGSQTCLITLIELIPLGLLVTKALTPGDWDLVEFVATIECERNYFRLNQLM